MNLHRMSAWSCFLAGVAAAPGIPPLCVPCEPSHRSNIPPRYMPRDRRPSQRQQTRCRGEQINSHARVGHVSFMPQQPPVSPQADVNRPCPKLLGEFAGKPYDDQPSSKQQYLTNVGTLTSSDAVQKETGFVKCFHLCNPINLAQACYMPFTV
ncbi:hypothetical protein LB506_006807 [Fusarium annulatum]|nr:hypothetical protein LB506_006807 [Fusarium annulatum]